jgi:cellulose synthase/poly-beta-1,6-N-acetylglucosamine synthase-like glycosyltransferase
VRQPPHRAISACPEIDCVRQLLPKRIIAAAERRAQRIGLGAERVLICGDAITEEAYFAALAASLGTAYEALDRVPRTDCPLSDQELIQAAAAGLLPLRRDGRLIWVIAPRGLTARRLADPNLSPPKWLLPFHLTSSKEFQRFVARHTQRALGELATHGLHRTLPLFSNAPREKGWRTRVAIGLVVLADIFFGAEPAMAMGLFGTMLCLIFLATAALRLWSMFLTERRPTRPRDIDDRALPVYSIICALYREAAVVEDLVAAIRELDYPPEKLDVKFVIEADDAETRDALARLELGAPFEIVTAPALGPRTKPKALNIVLPLVRGTFTVVYDAEDKPEPDQLRRAVAMFRNGDRRLACLQAPLTIDNTADSWLTRMFTAGYAGQFDILLPALAAMRLPLPLGGSSNHFRTAVLRQAGGWDPYNVTEDADLGIRLYRLGYRTGVLPSATYEEAPSRFRAWLKQRTRWYKGWMQTWLVHMRRPRRLWRDLNPAGALAFQLLLAGNVLSALVHPIFMVSLAFLLLAHSPLQAFADMGKLITIYAAAGLAGFVSTIALEANGLGRRSLLRHGWALLFTPVYWFLLSWAAWRALFQLLRDPQRWEKTEHGLARTSRMIKTRLLEMGRRPAIRSQQQAAKPIAPTAIIASPHGSMLDLARERTPAPRTAQ